LAFHKKFLKDVGARGSRDRGNPGFLNRERRRVNLCPVVKILIDKKYLKKGWLEDHPRRWLKP